MFYGQYEIILIMKALLNLKFIFIIPGQQNLLCVISFCTLSTFVIEYLLLFLFRYSLGGDFKF